MDTVSRHTGWIPFWPATASNTGEAVNTIFIGLFALSVFICLMTYGLIIVFGSRYRMGSRADRSDQTRKSWHWEIGWTSVTLLGFLGLFVWGAGIYVWLYEPPKGGEEVFVVGKQWMWKIQHSEGAREINTLHVPLGRVVRIVLASQDVIHSFFIPAFRIKHDAVPGSYETLWFKATKLGTYHLYCSEYCGFDHSHMRGFVIVMKPADYQRWLAAQAPSTTLAAQGEAVFREHGCDGCHGQGSTVHAPSLAGLFGKPVHLTSGETVIADEAYIHDCILTPAARRVAGFPPVMPSFSGQIDEQGVFALIAYIKSLTVPPEARP